MRALLAVFLLAASPALAAEDCRYYASNGDKIAVDNEYIVVFTKTDNVFCPFTSDQRDMVECPTSGDGDETAEYPLSIDDAGLHFQDQLWLKRCETGV